MISMSREDITELVTQLEDPEELCADLIEAIASFLHDGDPTELEELLDALESCNDSVKGFTLTSWTSLWRDGD